MNDYRNGPRKDGPVGQFKDAARGAWESGPFAFLVFLMFGVAPVLGLGYIVIRGVLGIFGVELPAVQTSVQ